MNKKEIIECPSLESILSEEKHTECLRRLYKEKGPITQDSLLAGLPEKTVPYYIDRADFVDNVIKRLIERNSITALFVLAAITWPEDIDLRRNLALIANELKIPAQAIPGAWSGLRSYNKEKLERLWTELKDVLSDHDVFICYSQVDKDIVTQIASRLKSTFITPWIDVWEVKAGDSFARKIEEVLAVVPIVAIFCGTKGLSSWQEQEVAAVMDRSVRKQCLLIPVLLPGVDDNLLTPFLKLKQFIKFDKENDPCAFLKLANRIIDHRNSLEMHNDFKRFN